MSGAEDDAMDASQSEVEGDDAGDDVDDMGPSGPDAQAPGDDPTPEPKAPGSGGEGGSYHHVESCVVCHDFHAPTGNLYLVPPMVETPMDGPRVVVLLNESGPYSLADGDETLDGVCEVCHTGTAFHRGTLDPPGSPEAGTNGRPHFGGSRCTLCHPHDRQFSPAVGRGHVTHAAGSPRGPALACDACHPTPAVDDEPGTELLFNDGQPLATTAVCDGCHSPDGLVDGVDDPVVGARVNWQEGVYDGDALQAGLEMWCAGCHDGGTSTVLGVSAPTVVHGGSFGFYTTGHGRGGLVTCDDCHDAARPHVDGVARSYVAAQDNYQDAFRLADVNGERPLWVPRGGWDNLKPLDDPPYSRLCFQCHDRYALFGGPTAPEGPFWSATFRTNFRNDPVVLIADGPDGAPGTDIGAFSVGGATSRNSHVTHMGGPPGFWDTDNDGEYDSYGTCVACHDVHGSAYPAMIRDGHLLGHEPGLGFAYLRYDRHDPPMGGCPDPIIMTSEGASRDNSVGAVMRAGSGPVNNGVCAFCHCSGLSTNGNTTGDPEFVVNCYGPDCVDYYRTPIVPPEPLFP